ncbi:MAG: hypothetical protein EOO61_06070, partial [Hymenobacter sp.]
MPNVHALNDPAANRGSFLFTSFAAGAVDRAVNVYAVRTPVEGNQLNGGSFQLAYDDVHGRAAAQSTTANVLYNAAAQGAASMQEKLQALTLLQRVSVQRFGLPAQGGGFEWRITFDGNSGNLLPLRVVSRAVSTSNVGQSVSYFVCDGSDDVVTGDSACVQGSELYGEFTLHLDWAGGAGVISVDHARAADAELGAAYVDSLLETALTQLQPACAGQEVSVSAPQRIPPVDAGWVGGYLWRVTFNGAHVIGDMPQLYTGVRAQLDVSVDPAATGANVEGLAFSMNCGASADADVVFELDANNALSAVGRVPVSLTAGNTSVHIVDALVAAMQTAQRVAAPWTVTRTSVTSVRVTCLQGGTTLVPAVSLAANAFVNATLTPGADNFPSFHAGAAVSGKAAVYE